MLCEFDRLRVGANLVGGVLDVFEQVVDDESDACHGDSLVVIMVWI
jgi:hypothetical protein